MLPKKSSGTQEFRNPGKPFPTFLASWVPYVALVVASPRYAIGEIHGSLIPHSAFPNRKLKTQNSKLKIL
jgi:hypothetical protein